MDFDLGPEADRLRARLRELIAAHLPHDFLGGFTDDPHDLELTRQFCKALAAERLLALAWPVEFGGTGASVWEQTVVREEMWAHHEPRGPQYMSLNWIGPAIIRFGTAEQQRRHLPPITAGDVLWCQGFSEPNAGSDLASLSTRARPIGNGSVGGAAGGEPGSGRVGSGRPAGGWRVTGQKIWTSYAQVADFCVLAARTGTPESRGRGISVFLVPMDRPGIEVRPIASMLGPYHLNEVFFTDVEVRPDELLGEENGGWEVIRTALAFERVGIARYARADRLLAAWRSASAAGRLGARAGGGGGAGGAGGDGAGGAGGDADGGDAGGGPGGLGGLPGGLGTRLARAMVHTRVARLMAYEVIDAQDRGEADDGSTAAARICAVLGDQEVSEVLVEAIGAEVFDSGRTDETLLASAIEDYWRYSRAATVAAGSVDIQRSIVASSVLGAGNRQGSRR